MATVDCGIRVNRLGFAKNGKSPVGGDGARGGLSELKVSKLRSDAAGLGLVLRLPRFLWSRLMRRQVTQML